MSKKNGKNIPCELCGTIVYKTLYRIKEHPRTYCSHKCYSQSLLGVKNNSCTKFKKGHKPWNTDIKGTHFSPATEFKMGQMANENHPHWKGEDASYSAVHYWVARHKKRKLTCDWCGVSGKMTHFANLDYDYTRDLDTWAELCPKCHMSYDRQNGWGQAKSKFSGATKNV